MGLPIWCVSELYWPLETMYDARAVALGSDWIYKYALEETNITTLQNTHTYAEKDWGSCYTINPTQRENKLRGICGILTPASLMNEYPILMDTTEPGFHLSNVFLSWGWGYCSLTLQATLRTYVVKNRCHSVCTRFGNVWVAHGSAVESLQGRLWEAGLDWYGFSPSLSLWDSDSFWAA